MEQNCSDLVGFPEYFTDCHPIDNYVTLVSATAEVFFFAYFAYLAVLAIWTNPSGTILQVKIIQVFILSMCIMTFLNEISLISWFIGTADVHPWFSDPTVLCLVYQNSLFSSIVSAKASTLAVLLQDATKLKKTRRLGGANYVSIFMSCVDPIVIFVWAIHLRVQEREWATDIWLISPWNMAVLIFNGLIILFMLMEVRAFKTSTSGSTKVVDTLVKEILILYVMCLIQVLVEYFNGVLLVHMPLTLFVFIYGWRMVPVFYYFPRKNIKAAGTTATTKKGVRTPTAKVYATSLSSIGT